METDNTARLGSATLIYRQYPHVQPTLVYTRQDKASCTHLLLDGVREHLGEAAVVRGVGVAAVQPRHAVHLHLSATIHKEDSEGAAQEIFFTNAAQT